jgi:hypothetical protein
MKRSAETQRKRGLAAVAVRARHARQKRGIWEIIAGVEM